MTIPDLVNVRRVPLDAGKVQKSRERQLESQIPTGKILGIRLDGKAFHTFTRVHGFKKPYDEWFMESMNEAAQRVVANLFPTAWCAYVQSDEITIFVDYRDTPPEHIVFSGKVEKIVSVAASYATAGFMASYQFFCMKTRELLDEPVEDKIVSMLGTPPVFDARLFVFDTPLEALENLHWRRMDARKNATTCAAEYVFGHKALVGKSTRERQAMLVGTDFEVLPEGFFNGRIIDVREKLTKNRWVIKPATLQNVEDIWLKLPDFSNS